MKVCKVCGDEFTPNSNRQLTCNNCRYPSKKKVKVKKEKEAAMEIKETPEEKAKRMAEEYGFNYGAAQVELAKEKGGIYAEVQKDGIKSDIAERNRREEERRANYAAVKPAEQPKKAEEPAVDKSIKMADKHAEIVNADATELSSKDKREAFLNEVAGIVLRDRNDQYGEPENTFKTIAVYWSMYLGKKISSFDVAMLMSLMKISRIQATGGKSHDSLVDLAGYAVCAASCDVGES